MKCSLNIFFTLFFTTFVLSTKFDSEWLINDFTPKNYLLEIYTTEEHFRDHVSNTPLRFTGKVTIGLEKRDVVYPYQIVLDTNPEFQLHSLKLEVFHQSRMQSLTVNYSLKKNKLVINLRELNLDIQECNLVVEYSNSFGNDMTGFYRSSYEDAAGNTNWILTTHFQPIFARKAFPCFDEPNLKAKFEIHINVPKSVTTVLSNTPIKKKVESKNSTKYIFKNTESAIPTYLVSFTACNFKGSDAVLFTSPYNKYKYGLNRKLRTFGRPELIERGDAKLAQRIAKEAVTKLTDYLGQGYAFEKIDQVGIPDFPAKAMENWGHISFREYSLFFNETLDSAATKQSNVLTITHELVHQWFGNLATIQSWDYIWLNEAFANYLQYTIASEFNETSTWNLLNQMVVNEIHLRAFETDGLVSSKPLNKKITDESLIFSSFNDISYSKGAAVLRMWNLQMNDNVFRSVLGKYMDIKKEAQTNPKHLQYIFEIVAGMDAANFICWTEEAGYPVVTPLKAAEEDDHDIYCFFQERFYWEPKLDVSYYFIPITYTTSRVKNFRTESNIFLRYEPVCVVIPVINNTRHEWIIVNNHQAGYYRVNYATENWKALSQAVFKDDHSEIPELNRAQLLNDVFSLARSLQRDYVDYSVAFDLAKYLEKEESFVVWKTAINIFEFLQTKIYNDKKTNENFKKYVFPLIKPHFKSLNSTGLDHVGKLKNVEISRFACSLDFDACVTEAKNIFKSDTFSKLPDTKEIILCTVVKNDKTAWDKVKERYQKEKDSASKISYISALGCSNNQTQVEEFLGDTLKENSFIRKKDRMFALSSAYSRNLYNTEVAFKFIENNYESIAQNFEGANPLGRALTEISKNLITKDHVIKLSQLANRIQRNGQLSIAKESVENALNITKINVEWMNVRLKQIQHYFEIN